MRSPVPKSLDPKLMDDLSAKDLLDRTMELDIRGLMYNDNDDGDKPASARANLDDPTVVLDLTATQVHDLLSVKNKK